MSAPNPRRKLLCLAHYPPMPGGSAKSGALLLRGLAEAGHRVHVLGSTTSEVSGNPVREDADPNPNLTVSRYSIPRFHTHSFIPEVTLKLQETEAEVVGRLLPPLIQEFSPDLLIAGHETLAHIVCPLARAHGIPSIVLLRGSPTWLIVQGRYPEDLTETYLSHFRVATRLVAVAEYFKSGLERLGIANCVHIPNFVNLSRFRPGPRDPELMKRWNIADDDIVVMQASLLHVRKRPIDTLKSAVHTLRENPKLKYLFVGGGEEEQELMDASASLGISDRVHFVGEVGYEEMPGYYNLADIVVMPSEGEGLSRGYLETQACQRVIIASDIPPAKEAIEHGVTGLLFKKGDIEDLAAKTLMAAGDPSLRTRLGASGRERVEYYDIRQAVEKYLSLIQEVTENTTGKLRD